MIFACTDDAALYVPDSKTHVFYETTSTRAKLRCCLSKDLLTRLVKNSLVIRCMLSCLYLQTEKSDTGFVSWDPNSPIVSYEGEQRNWNWCAPWEVIGSTFEPTKVGEGIEIVCTYLSSVRQEMPSLYINNAFMKRMKTALSSTIVNSRGLEPYSFQPPAAMAYTPLIPDISHGSAFKTVSTHEFINPSLSAMLLDRFDRLFEVNS